MSCLHIHFRRVHTSSSEALEKLEPLCIVSGNGKCAAPMESSRVGPQKITTGIKPYDAAISLLGVCPEELKVGLEEIFARQYS